MIVMQAISSRRIGFGCLTDPSSHTNSKQLDGASYGCKFTAAPRPPVVMRSCLVRYCFDTSGVNRLLDDPARDAIVTALLDTGSVRITAYNVIEAAKTEDDLRRRSLVNLMRRLSDHKRPLDRPNTLARAVARGYAKRSPDGSVNFSVNSDPDLDGVWVALNEPEELDEEARAEVLEWTQQWEHDYDSIAVGARARFQALIAKYPKAQRPTAAFTVRGFMRQRDQIYKGWWRRSTKKRRVACSLRKSSRR
jgi:hypothetical protein